MCARFLCLFIVVRTPEVNKKAIFRSGKSGDVSLCHGNNKNVSREHLIIACGVLAQVVQHYTPNA